MSQGDTSGEVTQAGIERFEAEQSTDGAQEKLVNAVRDVISGAAPDEVGAVAEWLAANPH